MKFDNMKLKIILPFAIIFLILFFSGCTSNNSINGNSDPQDNQSNDNSNNGPINSSWLNDYTPIHSIGIETNDFWINLITSVSGYVTASIC